MKVQRRSSSKAALAGEVWRSLFEFFISTRKQRDPALATHGLTPNDGKALFTLEGEVGKTMGALAAEWTCDASNATWIVDRLEKRGLAERRPSPGDRRVKMVVLTPLGERTKEQVMAAFYEPPAELLQLDRAELEALRDVLQRLTGLVREPAERVVPAETSVS